jgi:hypothetical protein
MGAEPLRAGAREWLLSGPDAPLHCDWVGSNAVARPGIHPVWLRTRNTEIASCRNLSEPP